MSGLHLVRLELDAPALMRFAVAQGLLRYDDDGHGYIVHAWLAAMFGPQAPQPFRFFDRRGELLGYCCADAETLERQARAFASPLAWTVLRNGTLQSKPIPGDWAVGERVQADVLTCPVSRKDGQEKDVFLRALDRLGDAAPPRAEVYVEWFRRQWGDAVFLEHVELTGFGRRRVLRRTQPTAEGSVRKMRTFERPFAEFRAVLAIEQSQAFADVLARGLGRHRAFGFGMLLLSPAV